MKSALIFALLFASVAEAGLNITSYNIRNFGKKGSTTDLSYLAEVLNTLDSDILGIQEIVDTDKFKSFIRRRFPKYSLVFSRCGGGGKQKLGIIYKRDKFSLVNLIEDKRLSDPDSRVSTYGCGRLRPALLAFLVEKETKKELVVINAHLKAGGGSRNYERRAKQYGILARIIEELELADYKNIVALGDMNTTGYAHTDIDYLNFRKMLVNAKFRTISENLNCTSYWSGENRNDNQEESSVLDHILYRKNLLGYKFKSQKVGTHCLQARCAPLSATELGQSYSNVSDHCPITAEYVE